MAAINKEGAKLICITQLRLSLTRC